MNSQQELLDAIKAITDNTDKSYDTPATVLRVDGDTVWVHIDGGADETPVSKTINCEQGETVQVRIANGSAFLVGNASAPPTDDKTANVAHFVAEQADIKAVKAEETATEVKETVEVLEVEVDGKVDIGASNIQHLSSTMYQNANGVNIFNDTLAVGDSYAHIDGDSFDIKKATTAGTIDDANDDVIASFGREVTVGSRTSGTVGQYSQVFGIDCVASGLYSHAEGSDTTAGGTASHSEGFESSASGNYSHAEGYQTIASGLYSHAEGGKAEATNEYSHAEGHSYANADFSHAEGNSTTNGKFSHGEGYGSTATGRASHAEGNSIAFGDYSHAEGVGTEANGVCSHAQNYSTKASSDYQTVIGKLNKVDANNTYAFIIGNGTESGGVVSLSDALRVKWNGDVLIDGDIKDLSENKKYISPTILTSTTISAATTSYTFTNAAITTNSVIDIYDDIFGFSPTGITVTTGSATITFSAQASTHTIKLFVY